MSNVFRLSRREHRPATIIERDKMLQALQHAKVKLELYRRTFGYTHGGVVEYGQLISEIEEAMK